MLEFPLRTEFRSPGEKQGRTTSPRGKMKARLYRTSPRKKPGQLPKKNSLDKEPDLESREMGLITLPSWPQPSGEQRRAECSEMIT